MKTKLDAMLLDLKDTSEMMVDLAYSSLLYDNVEIAEEVVSLSERLQDLDRRITDELVAVGQVSSQDLAKALVTTRLQSSIMDIAYAAESIADVVIRGLAEHPVLALSIRDSDTTICLAKVAPVSVMANRTLGQMRLAVNSGMAVIAIRRDDDYIFGPDKHTEIKPGDILIARGPEEAVGFFKDLADGTSSDLPIVQRPRARPSGRPRPPPRTSRRWRGSSQVPEAPFRRRASSRCPR